MAGWITPPRGLMALLAGESTCRMPPIRPDAGRSASLACLGRPSLVLPQPPPRLDSPARAAVTTFFGRGRGWVTRLGGCCGSGRLPLQSSGRRNPNPSGVWSSVTSRVTPRTRPSPLLRCRQTRSGLGPRPPWPGSRSRSMLRVPRGLCLCLCLCRPLVPTPAAASAPRPRCDARKSCACQSSHDT
jgi:hypothetical protein